jgi:superfamily II DNA/RNA helicase
MIKKFKNFRTLSFSNPKFFSTTFDSLKLHDYLRSSLKNLGYETLTTIQNKSLPLLLEKSNCLLLSETGTGKTLCYLLPIIEEILAEKERIPNPPSEDHHGFLKGRRGAIILTPSKELCVQIYAEARKLDKENKINVMRAGPLSYKSPIVKFLVNASKNKNDVSKFS